MAVSGQHADDLILFARIVEGGSFTRASELAGLPKSTLSRRLTVLEKALGERLMQRSTRRMVLTDFGEQMLIHARRLADEAGEAQATALSRKAAPQGTLRVSLPPEFRELSLERVVTEFTRRYPDVRMELDLSTRRVDLVAERFDVAVRAAARLPDDSTLVARRLVTLNRGLYASPDYLQRCGRPRQPADLAEHTGLMLVTGGGEQCNWSLQCGGEYWRGRPPQTLAMNSLGLLQELATRGTGIVALSHRFAEESAHSGALEQVLPQWCLPPENVWCVTAGRSLLPRRTSAFIEVLQHVLVGRGNEPGQGMRAE